MPSSPHDDHADIAATLAALERGLKNLSFEVRSEAGPFVQGAADLSAAVNDLCKSIRSRVKASRRSAQPVAENTFTWRQIELHLATVEDEVGRRLNEARKSKSESMAKQLVQQCEPHLQVLVQRLSAIPPGQVPPLTPVPTGMPGSPPTATPVATAPKTRRGQGPRPSVQELERAIVVFDLSRYTDKLRHLENGNKAFNRLQLLNAAQIFDQTIQDHLNAALKAIEFPLAQQDPVLTTTGDGAILHFERVELAVRFSRALHDISQAYNKKHGDDDELKQYCYRVGISFGYIKIIPKRPLPLPRVDRVGLPFSHAARMEQACITGQVSITESAWVQLLKESHDPVIRDDFSKAKDLKGKHRGEVYRGRQCQVIPCAPWDVADR